MQREPLQVAANVVHMCRHTVLISGVIILICFLFDMLFQNDMLTGCGVAAAITVFFCVTVNMTLTPCILIQFHGFFSKCVVSDFKRLKQYFWNQNNENEGLIQQSQVLADLSTEEQ